MTRPTRPRIALLALFCALGLAGAAPAAGQLPGSGAAAAPDVVAPGTPTVPAQLSLEDAIRLALGNNPALQATRNDRSLADWDVRAAYGNLLPSLSAGTQLSWQGAGEQRFGTITLGQLGFTDQPSYYFSSYNLGVQYQLTGAALLEPRRARALRGAVNAQVRAAEVELTAVVTRAYLEVLRQMDQVALARAQLERSGFNLRLARGRQEVGTATPLEVLQAEVQQGRAEVVLLQAENAVRTARLRLLQQIGLELDREVELTTEFPLAEVRWTRADLLALALERNPTLELHRSSREQAEQEVRVARSAYYPSLSLQAGISGFTREASSADFMIAQGRAQIASQVAQCASLNELYRRLADPLPMQDCTRFSFTDEQRRGIVESNNAFPFDFTQQPPSVSLAVSLPIFQGLGRERQMEAARLSRTDADQRIRQQRLALEAEVAIGLSTVETAHRSALLEARNREAADQNLRLVTERYRLGSASFQELVEAETLKAQADRDHLAAIYIYHDAVTNLEAQVGTSIRDR